LCRKILDDRRARSDRQRTQVIVLRGKPEDRAWLLVTHEALISIDMENSCCPPTKAESRRL
jgi:hypothetical protein